MTDFPSFPPDEILAAAQASPGRRFLGMASLGLLGVMVIWIALSQSPAPEWRIFLLAMGAAALWMADRMRRATANRIELTEEALRDSDGTVIARIADIEAMDRGFFAFKPSNGFLLRTAHGQEANTWRPGLWWRVGRRIGVGGMTPGSQTKVMSEIIAAMLAKREIEAGRR
ncbi:hypothetical protein [Sulfitobacter sp. S190]|uniref:hypothetical protein n=1 Tax=Sulfitobacter sp. S190 TaxID=2867022 RepID=UPI0021A7EF16|nr:hypothetical protein [Sulfitobacter sp. S190]UWR23526.1 hypothetical protein K3756_05990 [Sulfitobacter sp. S190]